MGSDEMWEEATNILREVLEERGMPYVVNEGDGAFMVRKLIFILPIPSVAPGSAVQCS